MEVQSLSRDAEPDRLRRLRVLRLSTQLFVHLFTAGEHPGYTVIENQLPDDCTVVNVRRGWPDYIELLLESKSFDEVSVDEPIPEIVVLCKTTTPTDGLVVGVVAGADC